MKQQQQYYYRNIATMMMLIAIATMAIMITTTTTATMAYAQSSNSNSRACPEGFSLNRGVCQAEPELTCENYNVHQPHTNIDDNGDCILTEYTTAVCLDDDTGQIIGYYFPTDDCIGNVGGTNQVIPNEEPECADPTNPNHPSNRATLVTVSDSRPSIQCAFTTNIGPADASCDVGTLNTETEMCEIKPERRNR